MTRDDLRFASTCSTVANGGFVCVTGSAQTSRGEAGAAWAAPKVKGNKVLMGSETDKVGWMWKDLSSGLLSVSAGRPFPRYHFMAVVNKVLYMHSGFNKAVVTMLESDQFRFFDVDHALSSVVFSLLDERDWVFVRVRFVERCRRGGRERRGFTGECFCCCLWHSFLFVRCCSVF